MIEPAGGRFADRDIVERMVDIRWVDTKRIEREADARCIADARNQQPDGPRNFGDAGQEDNLLRERYPAGRDLEETGGRFDMGDARYKIDKSEQYPEQASRQTFLPSGMLH